MPIIGLFTALATQALLAGPPVAPPEMAPRGPRVEYGVDEAAALQCADAVTSLPRPAKINEAVHDHYTRTDGTQVVEGHVDYTLSGGERASLNILIGDDGYGVAHFEVDGEVVVYATAQEAAPGADFRVGLMTETWVSPNINIPAERFAELFDESVTQILLGELVPQAFKCSAFGKKVMKWAKHLSYGAIGAGMAGCCALGSIPGCIVCGGVGSAAGSALGDAFDGHCE